MPESGKWQGHCDIKFWPSFLASIVLFSLPNFWLKGSLEKLVNDVLLCVLDKQQKAWTICSVEVLCHPHSCTNIKVIICLENIFSGFF